MWLESVFIPAFDSRVLYHEPTGNVYCCLVKKALRVGLMVSHVFTASQESANRRTSV
jgi:hypothetical protein